MTTKILLVEDNDPLRGVVAQALRDEDFVTGPVQLYEARDGEEAIETVMNNEIDLVILDVHLPVTNGWETLLVLRDPDNGWPDLPVIIMTAGEGNAFLRASMYKANYFIAKPVSVRTLLTTVHKALNNTGNHYQHAEA